MAFIGETADGIDVRVEGAPYHSRVWLDGAEVAVTGREQHLRDGGTRIIPTDRGVLTLPHRLNNPDRTPRLAKKEC